ncbi:MAG: amidase [Burkholderiales bacterium]
MSLAFKSASELARMIREKQISSRELLDAYLARIEKYNPALNAVVTLAADAARTMADRADAVLKRGDRAGELHGVPMTVKDTFEVAGLRTTAGAKQYENYTAKNTAVAVQRLIDAGAVIIGKSNVPEFAADLQSYNEIFGVTNNPWDLSCTPGGSSGGAAAAVAAGLTAFEIGSDIGGSIRTPAHFCGVYGHKPTWGLIPPRGHIPGPPGTLGEADLGVMGPLARSAEDLALALRLTAGPLDDKGLAWKLQLPPPRHKTLKQFKVALWLYDDDYPLDQPVQAQLETTVAALRNAGVQVDETKPNFTLDKAFNDYLRLLWPVSLAGLPQAEFQKLVQLADSLKPDDHSPRARMARYATMRHRDWLRANEAREHTCAEWQAFFRRYDVLLCPVNPVCAFGHQHSDDMIARTIEINGKPRWYWEQMSWISLATMSRLPATVAPAGIAANGLPVGIQIIGPYLEDFTTIEFARLMQDVTGGFQPPPSFL